MLPKAPHLHSFLPKFTPTSHFTKEKRISVPPVGSGRDRGQSCEKFAPGIEFNVKYNIYIYMPSKLAPFTGLEYVHAKLIENPWESSWWSNPISIIQIIYRFAMLTACRPCKECLNHLKAATFTAADKPGPRVGSWTRILSSWWFQPIWKILVKLDHFPR